MIIYNLLFDHKPKPLENISIENNQQTPIDITQNLSIMTFNIGFSGNDAAKDYFLEGGKTKQVTEKEVAYSNLQGMINYIVARNVSILFVQEIDVQSYRTHFLNELDLLNNALGTYSRTFALNHVVAWFPLPWLHPSRKIKAGMATFSKFQINKAIRHGTHHEQNFLKRLINLDRCFIETRFQLSNNKELVVFNLHLSVFVSDPSIKERELNLLKGVLKAETRQDNYIIMGGDWNQTLPDTNVYNLDKVIDSGWFSWLPRDFFPPGFKWVLDKNTPTARSIDQPFHRGENAEFVIDGFLVSDNIDIILVEAIDLGFKRSDHNPVSAILKLQP